MTHVRCSGHSLSWFVVSPIIKFIQCHMISLISKICILQNCMQIWQLLLVRNISYLVEGLKRACSASLLQFKLLKKRKKKENHTGKLLEFLSWDLAFGGHFLGVADDKLNILPFVCVNVVTGSQIHEHFSEKGRRLSSQVVETYFWR